MLTWCIDKTIDNKNWWEPKRWEKINKNNYSRKERKKSFNNLQESNSLRTNKLCEGPGKEPNKNSKDMDLINQKFNKIITSLKRNCLIFVLKIQLIIFIIKIKNLSSNINQLEILKISRNLSQKQVLQKSLT